MSEVIFEDAIIKKEIKNGIINLDYEDLPIIISWEGRKKYILKFTQGGGLLLNKHE